MPVHSKMQERCRVHLTQRNSRPSETRSATACIHHLHAAAVQVLPATVSIPSASFAASSHIKRLVRLPSTPTSSFLHQSMMLHTARLGCCIQLNCCRGSGQTPIDINSACLQAPDLRQLNVAHDVNQRQLLGSPRLQQDELSGGFIIAPGSETTAAVSEPLADIAGGKSGTEAEIENPYDNMPTAGSSGGHGDASPTDAGIAPTASTTTVMQDERQPTAAESNSAGDIRRQEQPESNAPSDEYSEQQQSQQASSSCKQS